MPCVDLALTGSGPYLIPTVIAAALIVLGLMLLRRGRRNPGLAAALIIVACVALVSVGPSPAAQAAACGTATNALTITQTSVLSGMSPDQGPLIVAGTVTNEGPDETYVGAIVVSLTGVTELAGNAPGTCDIGDFTLVEPRMPVDQRLAAGESATFSGATIAFRSDLTNQDACKGATVHLRYVTGS